MAPRTFTVATTLQDPLLAQRLEDVLQSAGIDAFVRAGGAASSAAFAAAEPAWWDLLVETDKLDTGLKLIAEDLVSVEANADANALAAEEEAVSAEAPTNSKA